MRVTYVAEFASAGSLHVRKRKIPGDVYDIPGFDCGMCSVIHPVASFRRNPTLSWSSAKTGLHPDVGAGLADALPLPASHFPSLITPSAAEMRRMPFLGLLTEFQDAQKWTF